MGIFLQSVLALLLLAAAAYAQLRIPAFARGTAKVVFTRTLLVLAGIGFGLYAAGYSVDRPSQLPGFLIGFGLVHVPAAFILFIKGRRGEGKS